MQQIGLLILPAECTDSKYCKTYNLCQLGALGLGNGCTEFEPSARSLIKASQLLQLLQLVDNPVNIKFQLTIT
jgi:hypothetical protein